MGWCRRVVVGSLDWTLSVVRGQGLGACKQMGFGIANYVLQTGTPQVSKNLQNLVWVWWTYGVLHELKIEHGPKTTLSMNPTRVSLQGPVVFALAELATICRNVVNHITIDFDRSKIYK